MSATATVEPGHDAYPQGLFDLAVPPPLRVRGTLPRALGVAIVGSRDATPRACEHAFRMAAGLVRLGFPIWSGGAVGVDRAAHEGALAAGGATVVVLGGGLDRPYPAEHCELFARVVARGGALVSLGADDDEPHPGRFFARNRVIAAATRVLVVIECGVKSGARNAAGHARRLGRPVLVVPHSPWGPGAGAVLELKLGAIAVEGELDVAEILGAPPASPARPLGRRRRGAGQLALAAAPIEAPLGADERRVLEALSAGARSADALCDALAWPHERVAPIVLELVLRGLVLESTRGLVPAR